MWQHPANTSAYWYINDAGTAHKPYIETKLLHDCKKFRTYVFFCFFVPRIHHALQLSTEKQQAAASIEAEKASTASAEAAAIEKHAEKELAQAEPAMLAAADAVNCLSKAMLTELKSLPKPPAGVDKASKR